MEQKYYKVVRRIGNSLYSSRTSRWKDWYISYDSRFVIEYKVLDWAYPSLRSSLLFVFTNLDTAKEFCNNKDQLGSDAGDDEIWECEIDEVFNIKPVNGGLREYWEDVSLLLRAGENPSNLKYSYCDVTNTISTKAVKLIKKVEPDQI